MSETIFTEWESGPWRFLAAQSASDYLLGQPRLATGIWGARDRGPWQVPADGGRLRKSPEFTSLEEFRRFVTTDALLLRFYPWPKL